MIIGFLGKGGSGKSTLATKFVEYSHACGKTVLALDADYNMDLAYNLKADTKDILFLGAKSHVDLKEILEVDQKDLYAHIVINKTKNILELTPPDLFTKKYSIEIKKNLRLMCVGPHTTDVLHGIACSHSMSSVLKAYLPLIKLSQNEFVVVDETAGTDSVGTGIPTGFNLSIIVVEATEYGIKAGKQIADLLTHYNVPYQYVINKTKSSTDITEIEEKLDQPPLVVIPFTEEIDDQYIEKIFTYCDRFLLKNSDTRYYTSVIKFKTNLGYTK